MKTGLTERLKNLLMDKNRKVIPFLFIILAAGAALLVLAQGFISSDQGTAPSVPPPDRPASGYTYSRPSHRPERPEIEVRLEEILSLVEGAGQTRVLLHISQGPERVFARDITTEESTVREADGVGGTREQSQQRTQSNIVTLSRREGGDEPLALYEYAPRIEGVIIVAEGGGNIFVKDALTRAASGLLGVAIHKITVLPMAPNP